MRPGTRSSAEGKSLIQSRFQRDEACSGSATGYPATDLRRSRQHTAKSSIHYMPSRYTRCSRAERCVFTPGDPHGYPLQTDWAASNSARGGIAMRKSAEGIRVSRSEPRQKERGGLSPTKARTVPARMDAGKWLWL